MQGWMICYGRFRRSVLDPLLSRINYHVLIRLEYLMAIATGTASARQW